MCQAPRVEEALGDRRKDYIHPAQESYRGGTMLLYVLLPERYVSSSVGHCRVHSSAVPEDAARVIHIK
jgi:hypothetical protein